MKGRINLLNCMDEIYSMNLQSESAPSLQSEANPEDKAHICKRSLKPEASHKQVVKAPAQSKINSIVRILQQHPLLKPYNLSHEDLCIVSSIYQRVKDKFDFVFSCSDILGFVPGKHPDIQSRFEYMNSLVDRKILSFSSLVENDFHHDIKTVFQAQYHLNGLLWNTLMGRDPLNMAILSYGTQFRVSDQPLDELCEILDLLFSQYPELKQDLRDTHGIYYGKTVNHWLDQILAMIAELGEDHWLISFIARHDLDPFWIKCFVMIYYYCKHLENAIEVKSLCVLLAENSEEYRLCNNRLTNCNRLKQEALLKENSIWIFANDLDLSEQALSELIQTPVLDKLDLQKSVAQSRFFSFIDPKQVLDKLILHQSTFQTVVSVINRLKQHRDSVFEQWGLMGASLSSDPDANNGCNVLLHGVPGTGKTYIAGVIANELGRPLLLINANNIRDSYYGSTEKRCRALFLEMRNLVDKFNPVFLLNEGDQLIHQRMSNPNASTDSTENTIQSIFLEEMETFPGILIVTSNLANNLDPAMSRRFHYKLEILKPDYPGRLELWKLHLPDTIPGALMIKAEPLAAEFPFTGGQIRNVVLNACHHAYTGGETGVLTFELLHYYARLEQGSSFETHSKTIGFC